MTKTGEIDLILHFFEQIGIAAELRPVPDSTFLPGILIEAGRLIIDIDKLKHPGDLLHEAGHIAVESSAERPLMHGNIQTDSPKESLELGAILWSYAALRHLNLPPEFVFHEEGYKGQSDWLIEQFEGGMYIGLPLLQWMGLTYDPKNAAKMNAEPFPFMLKWLRE
ncbi:MAG: hypothetical protein H7246_07675 [Phycisphaerae bacterium]|nr:hypothetical protein [Saprospiraceae bacterium]